jgi:hypothetical protein
MTTPVRLRRERRLPLPGDVLVSFGATVESNDIIARTELVPGNPYIADIARDLGVQPDRIGEVMLLQEGAPVHIGEIIARYAPKSGQVREFKAQADGVIEFISPAHGRVLIREKVKENQPLITIDVTKKLGVSPWQIRWYTKVTEEQEITQGTVLASEAGSSWSGMVASPVSGIVEKICPRTGTITIRRPYRPITVDAYIPGKVVEVLPNYGAIIEGTGYAFTGVFGVGGEASGHLRVVCAPDEVFTASMVSEQDTGKVLIGGCAITGEAITIAKDLKVRAVITGGIEIDTLESLGLGVKVVTGSETFGMTMVIMHGFGTQPMDRQIYELAGNFSGLASVSGATQIRAGLKRPELLLCSNGIQVPTRAGDADIIDVVPGAHVRVLMGEHQGQPGIVTSILATAHRLKTEEEALAAKVQLHDGETVEVPVRNLKIVT